MDERKKMKIWIFIILICSSSIMLTHFSIMMSTQNRYLLNFKQNEMITSHSHKKDYSHLVSQKTPFHQKTPFIKQVQEIGTLSVHPYHLEAINDSLQIESNFIFNATLDRTIYGSGSIIHIKGYLGYANNTPIAGNEVNITFLDAVNNKLTSTTENTRLDGSWNVDYQLSSSTPTGGYHVEVWTKVNESILSLSLTYTVVARSSITFISNSTLPNPPIHYFPFSIIVKLSSQEISDAKIIFTTDEGITWKQATLVSSTEDPATFTALLGPFNKSINKLQWFAVIIDSDGKIKESQIQVISFRPFNASITIDITSTPYTHVTHVWNVTINTNLPEDYYYIKVKAAFLGNEQEFYLPTWKVRAGFYQFSFNTTMTGTWTFTAELRSTFNNSILKQQSETTYLSLMDIHPPRIQNVEYDKSSIFNDLPVVVTIIIEENHTYHDLLVFVKYRQGTIEEGPTTQWSVKTLLSPGQNSQDTVKIQWEIPVTLKEGDLFQFQVIAIDGFNNTASSRLYTISYPLTREESTNFPFYMFLITLMMFFFNKFKRTRMLKNEKILNQGDV